MQFLIHVHLIHQMASCHNSHCFRSFQTQPKTSFTQAEIESLTDRIQNAGTEVVNAKAGAVRKTILLVHYVPLYCVALRFISYKITSCSHQINSQCIASTHSTSNHINFTFYHITFTFNTSHSHFTTSHDNHISSHHISSHFITSYFITSHSHSNTSQYTTSNINSNIPSHHITFYHITLHHTAVRDITVRHVYITVHYITYLHLS